MNTRFLLALSLFWVSGSLFAQNIEQVRTKDGSFYEGYFSEQVPGVRLDIYAVKATIHIPDTTAKETRDEKVPLRYLPETAQKYLIERGDTNSFRWTTLKTNLAIYDGIYQPGDSQILVFSPRTYSIPWNQISSTSKTPLSEEPWGMKDVVWSGIDSYEGIVTKQYPGDKMTVSDSSGNTKVLPMSDVERVSFECVNADSSIWKQAQLCDRIVTKEGDRIEGIIVSKDLVRGKISILKKEDEGKETVKLSDIKLFQKYPNPAYHPYQEPAIDTTRFIKLEGNEVSLAYLHMLGDDYRISGSETDINQDPSQHIMEKGKDHTVTIHNLSTADSVEIYRVTRKKGHCYIVEFEETDPVQQCFFRDVEGDKEVSVRIKRAGEYYLMIGRQKTKSGNSVRTGLLVKVGDAK